MSSEPQYHARCRTCGADLPTPEDANAHLSRTLAATPEGGSHVIEVLNPTEEQVRRSRARYVVQGAVYDAFGNISCDRGDLTAREIRDALAEIDLEEEWEEWLSDEG